MKAAAVRSDYVIERCCSHRVERFQAAFTQTAMQMLPRDESFTFQPDARGLLIAAETEIALERPVRKILEVYGDMVHIGPPAIRYRRGDGIEQPIMGLRVMCAPAKYEAVRDDLRVRNAAIMDAEVTRRFGIVRATAPLVALIGYPDTVSRMTDGHGQLVMWLSHYEHVKASPPDGTAA